MAPLAATDELADATALWQQRFGTAPANQQEKARQVRFLLSRGYGMSVALRVLRTGRRRRPTRTADAGRGRAARPRKTGYNPSF